MQSQHTINEVGNATAMIGRRALLAGAMSIATVPVALAASSIDELAWQADSHAELIALIQAYRASRAEDRALGQALDDLTDDPECPSVSVTTSEIRPPLGITGCSLIYSEEDINQYFDGAISSRRSWAGSSESFETRMMKSREHALSLIRERWKLYREWEERVGYTLAEKLCMDAAEKTDGLLEEILTFPCTCLSHAAAKAQFFAEYPTVFRCYPDRLSVLLATIADAAMGRFSNGY